MKFRVTFKTPDVLDNITDALCPHPRETMEEYDSWDVETYKEKLRDISDKVKATTDQFIQYNENITIEFDTESQSANVVKIRK